MYPKRSKERRNQLNLLRKQGNWHTTLTHSQKEKGHQYHVNYKAMARAIQRTISIVLHALGISSANFCGSTQNGAHLLKVFAECYLGKQEYRHASAQSTSKDVSMKVWTLVNAMTQDEIAHAVKEDKYIMKVRQKVYNWQRETASQHDNVRQIMRRLGRLLVLGRTVTPLKTMEDYIHPQHFHHVTQAVKEVAGFESCRHHGG